MAFDSVSALLDGLRQGQIDLVPLATRTVKRTQEFAFSNPYLDMPYVMVARSDAPYYWGLDSLRGKTLALRLQHPLRELIAASYADIRVIDADSAQHAMDLVLKRAADATVDVKLFVNLRISQQGGERLRVVAEIGELPSTLHFASNQAGAPLLSLVNRALADIDASERQRMLRRWVAVDLAPVFPWRRHAPLIAAAFAFGHWVATPWGRLQRGHERRARTATALGGGSANPQPDAGRRQPPGTDAVAARRCAGPGVGPGYAGHGRA